MLYEVITGHTESRTESPLPESLACRAGSAPYQGNDGLGRTELQEARDGAKRNLGVFAGLQSDPPDDGTIGLARNNFV